MNDLDALCCRIDKLLSDFLCLQSGLYRVCRRADNTRLTSYRVVAPTAHRDKILPANPARRYLEFSMCVGTQCQVWFDNDTVTTFDWVVPPNGTVYSGEGQRLKFLYRDTPALVTSNWWAFSQNAGTILEIVEEVELPE